MGPNDEQARELYLAGKTRKEAMNELGITNSNSMASLSYRLRLHWSWPLDNRKSGITPEGTKSPRAPQSNTRKPRPYTPVVTAPPHSTAVTSDTRMDTVKTRTLLPPSSGFVSARDKRLRGIIDRDDVGKPLKTYLQDPEDLAAARFLEEHYAQKFE